MLKRLVCFLFAGVIWLGCHDKKVVKTEALESAFKGLIPAKGSQSTSPENAMIAAYVEQASAAIKTNDYFGANMILQDLRAQPNLTFEQSMAVQDTMASVQLNLVTRAEAGDVAAQQALQAMKMRRRR